MCPRATLRGCSAHQRSSGAGQRRSPMASICGAFSPTKLPYPHDVRVEERQIGLSTRTPIRAPGVRGFRDLPGSPSGWGPTVGPCHEVVSAPLKSWVPSLSTFCPLRTTISTLAGTAMHCIYRLYCPRGTPGRILYPAYAMGYWPSPVSAAS